jgi:hypothetical protein
MTDYYLRAESEEALWAALVEGGAATTYEVKNTDGQVVETRNAPTHGYNIDIIGTIYKPTGNLIQQQGPDNTTIEVPEMEALEGFHANMRGPFDLAPKVEYIPYVPTEDDLKDPDFIMPMSEEVITPSPIQAILVDPIPKAPVRVWF